MLLSIHLSGTVPSLDSSNGMLCVVGLLLSAMWARDIDRQRWVPGAQQHGAAARCSAANAGSVMLIAEE